MAVRNGSGYAVETAKGTRLMVDSSLHLIKGSPSTNRKQARSNCVQDGNTSQEETDYVVVGMVSIVDALHPAAQQIETCQTEGHKHSHGKVPNNHVGRSYTQ